MSCNEYSDDTSRPGGSPSRTLANSDTRSLDSGLGLSSEASLSSLRDQAEAVFYKRFGCKPQLLVAAPGRVNLIGDHVDYNDGFALPMAIDKYVVIACAPKDECSSSTASVFSACLNEEVCIPLNEYPAPDERRWDSYIKGVLAGFLDRSAKIPSLNAVILSNVPLGAGLSSSAALEVAVATLFEALAEMRLDPKEKALLCQRAEHQFAGVPCGIMDQFCSIFGMRDHLILLDCVSHEISPVPFESDEVILLVANTNVQHELIDGEYAKRRDECASALSKLGASSYRAVTKERLEANRDSLSPPERRRARHVVSESHRTILASDALRRKQWARVGELMYSSHSSLSRDFDVSCNELDLLVDIARQLGPECGVYGSRMTGGGFGGCTVSLVKKLHLEAIMRVLQHQYEDETGFPLDVSAISPSQGAQVLKN